MSTAARTTLRVDNSSTVRLPTAEMVGAVFSTTTGINVPLTVILSKRLLPVKPPGGTATIYAALWTNLIRMPKLALFDGDQRGEIERRHHRICIRHRQRLERRIGGPHRWYNRSAGSRPLGGSTRLVFQNDVPISGGRRLEEQRGAPRRIGRVVDSRVGERRIPVLRVGAANPCPVSDAAAAVPDTCTVKVAGVPDGVTVGPEGWRCC